MFVKFARRDFKASKLIKEVRFGLHETFRIPHKDIKPDNDGKFEMTYTGWGTFSIPITIYFRKGLGME